MSLVMTVEYLSDGCNLSTFPGFPLTLIIFALFTGVPHLACGWVRPFHEWVTACPTLHALSIHAM